MSKEEKNAVIQQSAGLPADIKLEGGDGFENTNQADFSLPFLKIVNPTSQLDQKGVFHGTASGKNYGSKIRTVVIGYYQDYQAWDDDSKPAGRFSLSEFAKVKHEYTAKNADFVKDGITVKDTRNFFVLLPDHINDGMMKFPLAGANVKHAKRIMSLLKMKGELYKSVISLELELCKYAKGQAYEITGIDFDSYVSKESIEKYVAPARRAFLEYVKSLDKENDGIPI